MAEETWVCLFSFLAVHTRASRAQRATLLRCHWQPVRAASAARERLQWGVLT